MKIKVKVQFKGVVEVEVPDSVPAKRRRALAENVALARILATTENPDAPEEDFCDDYAVSQNISEEEAGDDWDSVIGTEVGGSWKKLK